MSNFLKIVGIISLAVIAFVSKIYVLSVLWNWFVTPVFNIQSPSLPIIAGMSLLVALLTFRASNLNNSEDSQEGFQKVLGLALAPWATLASAWIVLQFV
jgi:hypothetical protein